MRRGVFFQVYDLVRQIPLGQVSTYGQLARMLGNPRLARAVGYALNGCQLPDVPCHRVVNRFGGLSDAFTPLGRDSHRLLLEMEGVPFTKAGLVDLSQCQWNGPAPSALEINEANISSP